MSGDDVRSSNNADARKKLPTGAGTAREAASENPDGHGQGRGQGEEIRWVGLQHRMYGYCGRGPGGEAVAANAVPAVAPVDRPVAVLHRPRGVVVRIGPKRIADIADAQAKAA